MPFLRLWRPSDLPDLLQMAITNAWETLPEDDKRRAQYAAVARNAYMNLLGGLQSPFGTAVVADEGGRPIGYLLVGLQPNGLTGQPAGYLADIYVQPAFRRHGLGLKLHQAAEAYLRQLGVSTATNWTHAHNKEGQAASKRHGLPVWGMMMVKHLTAPTAAKPGQKAHQ